MKKYNTWKSALKLVMTTRQINMEHLQITAYLANPVAVYDRWSPSLENILIDRLLKENNLLFPVATLNEFLKIQEFLVEHLPIKQFKLNDEKYWCISSPCYVFSKTRLIDSIDSISWYAVGDKSGINELIKNIDCIQKMCNAKSWGIMTTEGDRHMWHEDKLIKPIPVRLMPYKLDNPQKIWGWKYPDYLHQELCYMPVDNVFYQN